MPRGICADSNRGLREVTDDELSGKGAETRLNVAARNIKISGAGVRESGASQSNGSEFSWNHANTGTDIKKMETVKRLAADLG